ncbi:MULTISPECIES: PD-(D/E)XK nuclease family protein [Thermodesulfovibrio]|uniref:PD-(D/E)XK nuclease family protein n=1 Tax=Thermodesulfovibrio yellowstonii TaxID=28262 RepID=UPI0003FF7C57|nr:PD-(D/E)XK nuclease family protein [Thermodesulfovibrio islandicus]
MIRLNARSLGEILKEDFCPRCFWLKYHHPVKVDNPYSSPMPGMFSTLDAYIKQVINTTFSITNDLPKWVKEHLSEFEVVETIKPNREKVTFEEFELLGEPDAIWRLKDGSIFIADYKTAQLTDAQKNLLPLYEAQLNAYAYLLEQKGEKVKYLALIYLQPQRYKKNADISVELSKEKLTLHFDCVVKLIDKWNKEKVEELAYETVKILSLPEPPRGRDECKSCQELNKWLEELWDKVIKYSY